VSRRGVGCVACIASATSVSCQALVLAPTIEELLFRLLACVEYEVFSDTDFYLCYFVTGVDA